MKKIYKRKSLLLCSAAFLISVTTYPQVKFGENKTTINAGSLLELESSTAPYKGFLPPRVSLSSTTTWTLNGSGVAAMVIYNTNTGITSSNSSYPILPGGKGMYFWDGAGWVGMAYPAVMENIYTADGTLTDYRFVDLNGTTLELYDVLGGSTSFNNVNGPYMNLTAASSTGRSAIDLYAGTSSLSIFIDGGGSSQIIADNSTSLYQRTMTAAPIIFGTGNTQRMIISAAGNVGICTNSPAAVLDVAGTFKMGAKGTANKNLVSFAGTLSGTAIPAGTSSAAGSTDFTVTIPAANQPTTTQATVLVSPNFDLPATVSIASARLSAVNTVKVRFVNGSTTAATLSGTSVYITIQEF